ncbi:hypothetical protein PGT21_027176 [Puccinia graminis f. sp. tritici]|uniref:Secreted protein n=2 Tax=Puccinia graminis f. sp. tritici TaxID=56615 RepID=E3KQD0_PUCGT|nr:uncharacterized protein PGTG_12461 [Puccinia graminis f. sp. tritici CRL 75-36-700-3]EFP86505.2 hypothetical protein PGTG_12461 [Puccinia graminis f. sp. tritici CRL 75-36-700-3]KAA1113285.1 hypothetical protein PGT21_027176 [Puccinia graminis f. sp. tritici]KAA1132502.1 hypothetical protein PGTUg99_006718 [Puccinia graminis f. sp. tritici]
MFFRPIAITSLFTAVLWFGFGSRVVLGDIENDDEDCQIYTDARSPTATCNGIYKCAGGCTGYVTATNCTRSQQPNDMKPPLTTEKCKLGYGKSSATMAICINEDASFTCYGPATGKAECKGCVDLNHQGPSGPDPHSVSVSGDNSKGGSNTTPIVDTNGPNVLKHSSGATIRINMFIFSLGTLLSVIFF